MVSEAKSPQHLCKSELSINTVVSGVHSKLMPLLMPEVASFSCDDPHAAQLRDVGLHTMHLCMHDHYEDCPWREQALYAYDSRNQMLFGYYAWGNYQFAAASLDLLGQGLQTDGHINLCAPTHRSTVIPVFTYVWVTALYEHYLYSGDDTLLLKFTDSLKAIVDRALARRDPATGLVTIQAEKPYWNFTEWAAGVDGGRHGGVEAGAPAPDEVQTSVVLKDTRSER